MDLVAFISSDNDLIKTESERLQLALRVKIKVPIVTHYLMDMVEYVINVLSGFLQSTVMEYLRILRQI